MDDKKPGYFAVVTIEDSGNKATLRVTGDQISPDQPFDLKGDVTQNDLELFVGDCGPLKNKPTMQFEGDGRTEDVVKPYLNAAKQQGLKKPEEDAGTAHHPKVSIEFFEIIYGEGRYSHLADGAKSVKKLVGTVDNDGPSPLGLVAQQTQKALAEAGECSLPDVAPAPSIDHSRPEVSAGLQKDSKGRFA